MEAVDLVQKVIADVFPEGVKAGTPEWKVAMKIVASLGVHLTGVSAAKPAPREVTPILMEQRDTFVALISRPQGASNDEIAKALNISPGGARKRIKDARDAGMRIVDENEESPEWGRPKKRYYIRASAKQR